jgi:hypothetical protein
MNSYEKSPDVSGSKRNHDTYSRSCFHHHTFVHVHKIRRTAKMKKAQTELVIMTLILIYLFRFARNETDRELCKFSLQAAASSKLLGEPLFHVDCKRQEVLIKASDLKPEDDESVDKQIFQKIQTEIYSCYTMIPESLVKQEYPFRGGNDPWTKWQYENNICLICSTIKFDEKLQDKKWEGLNRWLLENPVPEQQKSLKNIFYSSAPTQEDYDLAEILDQTPIKGSETYVVVVQWRAEGIFKEVTEGSALGILASINPVLGIPAMIRQANTIHCMQITQQETGSSLDTETTECDPKYPVFVFMNINDLGEPMGNVGTKSDSVSKAFCSVLWN